MGQNQSDLLFANDDRCGAVRGLARMSAGHGSEEPAPPVRRQWLSDRIESLRQDLQPLLTVHQTSDAGCVHPSVTTWGWLREAKPQVSPSLDGPTAQNLASRSYVDALRSSGRFRAPDADVCLADEFGLSEEMHGLRGTVFAQGQANAGGVGELREALAKRMDSAWSNEALRRGVESAKAGDYDSAQQAYSQALDLNPDNADALVARGAARANQGQLRAALNDMDAALKVQPGDPNATRYKEAIASKLRVTETAKLTPGGEVLEYRSGILESKVLTQEKGPLPVVGEPSTGANQGVQATEDERIQEAMKVIESAAKRKQHSKKRKRKERWKEKSRRTKSSRGKSPKHEHKKKKTKRRGKKTRKSSRGGEGRGRMEATSDSSPSLASLSSG